MDKQSVWQFLTSFLSESKDPRALFFRVCTTLAILLIFNVVSNPEFLIEWAKGISRESVVHQLQKDREKAFSKLSQERVSVVYTQSRADLVLVTRYLPKYLNNNIHIEAIEGTVNYRGFLTEYSLVDKTSRMYQEHLKGRPVIIEQEESSILGHFTTLKSQLKDMDIKYFYTCPYFDLDALYTGYVGIGWVDKPVVHSSVDLEEYLFNICAPHARALGRSI